MPATAQVQLPERIIHRPQRLDLLEGVVAGDEPVRVLVRAAQSTPLQDEKRQTRFKTMSYGVRGGVEGDAKLSVMTGL